MNNEKISIVMAVYNGEKFIKEQIDSILMQMGKNDELIISYNISQDNTEKIIDYYVSIDNRVKKTICKENGIISNFENGLKNCTGKIIFLADQDDVWEKNKISICVNKLNSDNLIAVMHDCYYYDENLRKLNRTAFERGVKNGTLYNILKNSYQGSCMAFRADILPVILPIPRKIAMHDQWIGIISNKLGNVSFIDDKLIKYRQHSKSMSKKVNIFKKMKYIYNLLIELIKIKANIKNFKNT